MTTFKAALAICGLSQAEAADYLGVSLQSIKNWSRGKSSPSHGVWEEMADLYRRVEDAAIVSLIMIDPHGIDRAQINNTTADAGDEPLPGHGGYSAGALAYLLAFLDTNPPGEP